MTHDEIEKIARTVCASGMCEYRKWEDAYVVISTGVELGLKPMRALQTIHNMRGKPSPSAALIVGLVKGADVCQSWRTVESTDEVCTISTRRRGEEADETLTYTMRDAKRAGLGGNQWNKFPRQMLYARCSGELARRVYPDVVAGLYAPEELDHDTPAPAPAAPRVSDVNTKRARMVDSDTLPEYVRRVAEECEEDEVHALFQQAMVLMKGSTADRVRELATGVLAKYQGGEHSALYVQLFGRALAATTDDANGVHEAWLATSEADQWTAIFDVTKRPDSVAEVAAQFVGEDDDE